MLHSLTLHPDSRCDAVARIDVEAERPQPQALNLTYRLTGDTAGLYIPALTKSTRTDELWRRTCFEAFLRAPNEASYLELNLSPSTQWAAYNFTAYRKGMADAHEIGTPLIDVATTADTLMLRAELDLSGAPITMLTNPWQVAISAVIEEKSGRVSYWGLAHPPGKFDFHHSDCFALELG